MTDATLDILIMTNLKNRGPMTNRELIDAIYGELGYVEFKSKRNIVNALLRKLVEIERIEITEIRNHGAYVYGLTEGFDGQDA